MSRRRKKIYVLMTFKVRVHPSDNSREIGETGCTYWFRNEKYALDYLNNAGKLFRNACRHDDPFEQCWPYAVIEEVYEGPVPPPGKVIGWWKCEWDSDGHIVQVEKLDNPPIDGTENSYGFVGLGS